MYQMNEDVIQDMVDQEFLKGFHRDVIVPRSLKQMHDEIQYEQLKMERRQREYEEAKAKILKGPPVKKKVKFQEEPQVIIQEPK